MKIKETLKDNKFTYNIITKIRDFQYITKKIVIPNFIYKINFNIKKFLRVKRINKNSCYEKLRNIKNKHKGERCFIVATGPSLTIEDLEKLKDEVTFSMNSICLAFNDTDWRPTYYGIQFDILYKELKKHIDMLEVEGIFIADSILNEVDTIDDYYIYPLNLLNHTRQHRKFNSKFSSDAFAQVFDGYSITYSLIQIAVYLGFKEIYLLGADCNYSSNMNHHFKDYSFVDPAYSQAGNKMISAYKEAKKYADKNNIKIYNATRGGMLEVFERINLDTVLKENYEQAKLLNRKTI
ncbi:DUF115 domain-containing protein [Bacillus sp. MM2020_1]|nr:DUF115 domain-containing protein [Bacillus sp. MM2020_1]